MKVEQLFAAYPAVVHAISWVELMLCPNEYGTEDCWQMLLDAKLTPEEMLDVIRASTEGETAGKVAEARAEFDHPQFKQYLLGKLGML